MKANLRRIACAPDRLAPDDVISHLATRWLGRTCRCFDSVSSTMDVARRLASANAPDGTIVVAERQTAGRGRMGRRWQSRPGLGIWCSMLLPAAPGMGAGSVGQLVAAGVAAALRSWEIPLVAVKWPNDVVISTWEGGAPPWVGDPPRTWPVQVISSARKVAGILIEMAPAAKETQRTLIVGVGLNVNHVAEDFPEELRDTATSVRSACSPEPRASGPVPYARGLTLRSDHGKQDESALLPVVAPSTRGSTPAENEFAPGWVNRAALLATVLSEVEARLDRARDGTAQDGAALVREWNDVSLVVGRPVQVIEGSATFTGRALEIRPDGALVIERTGGGKRTLYDASVSVRVAGTDTE